MQLFAKSGINEVIADKDYPTISLLNFALDGTAELLNADKTEVVGRYTISVDADINPFPLLKLLKGTDKENISAILKQLGYLSVVVDEVDVDSNDFVKNIITIHSNFADGLAVVQIYGEKISLGQLSLGGVYEFDALIDVIGSLTATTAADGGIDIGGLIETLLGYCDFSNLAENGFTFQISKLPEILTPLLGDLAGTLGGVLGGFWKNAEYINVKLQTPAYGVVNDEIKVTDISKLSAYESTGSDAFVSEVTDIGIDTIYSDTDIVVGTREAVSMKGIGFDGKEVDFNGYITYHTPIDFSEYGNKEVTFYVSPANDGAQLINFITGAVSLPEGIPFFGISKITKTIAYAEKPQATKVTVVKDGAEVKELNLSEKENKITVSFKTGNDVAIGSMIISESTTQFKLDDGSIIQPKTKQITQKLLDSQGNDVTAKYTKYESNGVDLLAYTKNVPAGAEKMPAGKYTLRLEYSNYYAEITINVTYSE